MFFPELKMRFSIAQKNSATDHAKKGRPKIQDGLRYEYGSIYNLINVAPNFLNPNVDACIT